MIGEFQGPHRFLSNFWPAKVEWGGLVFPSVENAYQAAKCADPTDRQKFVDITPGAAKRLSRLLPKRPDWDDHLKVEIMKDLITQKFTTNQELQKKLLATGKQKLVEGNGWGDTFWGVSKGKGDNKLGQLLMDLRDQLRQVKHGT